MNRDVNFICVVFVITVLLIITILMMSFRVGIHTTLVSLREEIASQLSPSLLPGQYVYLRNLGRCFTWVS